MINRNVSGDLLDSDIIQKVPDLFVFGRVEAIARQFHNEIAMENIGRQFVEVFRHQAAGQ